MWISTHLLMASISLQQLRQFDEMKRSVLGLWHLLGVAMAVGWVGATFTPGV